MTAVAMPDVSTPDDDETGEGADDGTGPLLSDPPKKAARKASQLWDAMDVPMSRRMPTWERNRLSRKGIRGVRIMDTTGARDDTDGVWVPPGAQEGPPVPNNVDQLVRRIVDTVTSDPPRIEASAPSGDDADVEAATLATDILEQEDSDAGGNLRAIVQDALNLAGTYASCFSYQYVDPYGVREPLELLAHPNATDPNNPLIDPTTGQPAPSESVNVRKYVVTDPTTGARTLSTKRKGCEYVWKPVVREELLKGHCVRLLPPTCDGMRTATGVFLGRLTDLGSVKSEYPAVAEWSPQELRKLCAWRPKVGQRHWAPLHLSQAAEQIARALQGTDAASGDQVPDDSTPVYLRLLFLKPTREYPEGVSLVLGNQDQLVTRGTWCATVGDGDDAHEEAYELPISQLRFFNDPNDSDPYGLSPVEWLAPMDEAIATQVIAQLEYLFRFNHPNTFLPLGSPIQPGQLAIRDGTPIRFDPTTGKPEYEQIPPFPADASALVAKFEGWMRTLSGLENAARGVADPGVTSGVHAQRIIEQALVALTQVISNTTDFLLRRARIRLQLIATTYTAPRLLTFGRNGGVPQVRAFQGADLRGVRNVRLAKNSMTMLNRSDKIQLQRDELEIAIKAQDPSAFLRYRETVSDLVDGVVTDGDDPHAQRVQRQLTAWRAGPPPVDPMQQQQIAQAKAQQAAQQQAIAAQRPPAQPGQPAAPMPPLPPIPDPVADAAAQIWTALPVDDDPMVAPIRAYRLGRAMASDKFGQFPAPWNAPLVQAYSQARQAAGMMNAVERAKAQQAAQQQQLAAKGGGQSNPQTEIVKQQARAQADQAKDVTASQLHQQEQHAQAQADAMLSQLQHQHKLEEIRAAADAKAATDARSEQHAIHDQFPALVGRELDDPTA